MSPEQTLAMQRHIIAGFIHNETQAQDAGKDGESSDISGLSCLTESYARAMLSANASATAYQTLPPVC